MLRSCRKKKFSTPDTSTTSTRARRRPASLPNHAKPAVFDPFVDKLLNIHRIECAKVANNATTNFLSSFGPSLKQGLFNRFGHT
jgi:hypothetical protein